MTLIAGNVCSLITGLLTILIFFAAKDATISTWHPLDINHRQYSFSETCAFESHSFANIFIPIPNTYIYHEFKFLRDFPCVFKILSAKSSGKSILKHFFP